MLTQNKTKTFTGAKIIIESLKSLGIDTIFGYPGGVVLDLYDELYNEPEMKHILVRHEQSAVHCAEGYSRVTGKCGVVLVTSGPGATNTVTGLANAYLDGYPLIILTGQVSKELIGLDSFQEADICSIAKSCTKAVFQITDAKDISKTIVNAYNTAMNGKCGPVIVDISKNVFSENVEFKNNNIIENVSSLTDINDFININEYLSNSLRPVFVMGGGMRNINSSMAFEKLALELNIPVVSTMMGLGNYNTQLNNYFGMIGLYGDNSANELLKSSDLIISFGARWNDRITCIFNKNEISEKLIQIDINEKELSRNLKSMYTVCSDVGDYILFAKNTIINDLNFSNWLNSAQSFKTKNILPDKISNMLHSYEVINKINEFTKDKNIIFSSEVGQHLLWTVKGLDFSIERKILLSGGAGTMGFGIPASIGACIADPNKTLVCITGDGSIQMSLGELALCRDYNLNLKIMILNNGYLGMVRQLQQKNCNSRYSQTKISNPDFVKLAQSYGISALKVRNIKDIDYALEKAFSTKQSFIVDFEVEPMEVV